MGKIQDIVDERSVEIRGSYDSMLLIMQGAWMGFTANLGEPAQARKRLSTLLGELVRAYEPPMRALARGAVVAAYAQGIADAQGKLDPTEPPIGFVEEAQAGVDSAIARDARGLAILASKTLIRYDLARRSMSPQVARLSALGELPSQGQNLFVQLDRLQRKRNSSDFVVGALRMVMFAAYFHAFTAALAAQGIDSFQAVHPDQAPVDLQLLTGWNEWLVENTHPNTRWSLQLRPAA